MDECLPRRNCERQKCGPLRHDAIVSTLRNETLDKCAYCEGVIGDVSYPHVEHIVPKSKRPELVVEWTNLTIGCSVCNSNKGDYFEPSAPLLNPYVDEPTEHLVFRGPAILGALDSQKGSRTVAKLQLMRGALVLERIKSIESLHRLIERWARESGPDKEILADVIRIEIGDDREFAQSRKAYAESLGFPLSPV